VLPCSIAKLLHELRYQGFVIIELRLTTRNKFTGLTKLSFQLRAALIIGRFEWLVLRRWRGGSCCGPDEQARDAYQEAYDKGKISRAKYDTGSMKSHVFLHIRLRSSSIEHSWPDESRDAFQKLSRHIRPCDLLATLRGHRGAQEQIFVPLDEPVKDWPIQMR
jgi:hypothetical protein